MTFRTARPLAVAATLAAAGFIGMQAFAQQPAPPAASPPAVSPPAASPPAAAPADPAARPDAGPRDGRWREGRRGERGPAMSAEDRAAFLSARIAGLKAGLQLTPEQDKLWPAAESAVRDALRQRAETREKMRAEQPPADPIERMRRAAEMSTQRGETLKRVADGVGPLYASLSDDQKRRLRMLSRGGLADLGMGGGMGGGIGMGRGMGRGMRHHGHEGRGHHEHRGREHRGRHEHRGWRHDDDRGRGWRQGSADGEQGLRRGADWTAPGAGFDRGGFLDDWRSL